MRTCFIVLLGMAAFGWAAHASAQDWHYYPALSEAGFDAIVVGDLNGDGIDEAVITGRATTEHIVGQVLAVLGGEPAMPEQLRSVTQDQPYTASASSLVSGRLPDGSDIVAALVPGFDASIVAVYSGVPMRRVRTIDIARNVRRVAGMVDLGGEPKLVALLAAASSDEGFPAIIDFTTGAIEWVATDPAYDVAVAPLGPDGASKLIMAGTPGRILDATTRVLEWTWARGFGREIAVGKFGPQGQPGFAIRTDVAQADPEAAGGCLYRRSLRIDPILRRYL